MSFGVSELDLEEAKKQSECLASGGCRIVIPWGIILALRFPGIGESARQAGIGMPRILSGNFQGEIPGTSLASVV